MISHPLHRIIEGTSPSDWTIDQPWPRYRSTIIILSPAPPMLQLPKAAHSFNIISMHSCTTWILLAYCTPHRTFFNRAPVTELSFERSNVIIRIYHVCQVCPTAIVMIKHTGSCFSNVEIFIIHQSILHCVRTCRQRQAHTHTSIIKFIQQL